MANKRARGVSKPLFSAAELKGSKRRQGACLHYVDRRTMDLRLIRYLHASDIQTR
jgi:hypothetical protein